MLMAVNPCAADFKLTLFYFIFFYSKWNGMLEIFISFSILSFSYSLSLISFENFYEHHDMH